MIVRAYDENIQPPAPVAGVVVAHPVTGDSSSRLRGRLDTGADVTVIPRALEAQLGLSPQGHVWTRGYDGSYLRRTVFYVRLDVEGFEVPAARCVAADRQDVLLGRNVLNRSLITLDGKALALKIEAP